MNIAAKELGGGGHVGQQDKYKPALSYRWLTRFYDPLIRVALRQSNFMQQLVSRANIHDHHNVLDLGCGTARLSITVKSNHPNATVVGLDADAEILAVARRNVKEAGFFITLLQGMSFDMPFEDRTFDHVVSSLLFHHLSSVNKVRTLREVRRVLKPGGTLHILDWGKPQNLILRLAFLSVQIFDGFDTTADNARGLIPQFMEEVGFQRVMEVKQIATVGGSLSLYCAVNPS